MWRRQQQQQVKMLTQNPLPFCPFGHAPNWGQNVLPLLLAKVNPQSSELGSMNVALWNY